MKTYQYPLPDFLADICTREQYVAWLNSQATRHRKRDRKRGNTTITREQVKRAIHAAVIASDSTDPYTGERLHWDLISKWSNDAARDGRRDYKRKFHLLPTVDHVGDGRGVPNFRICGWRTNDCKTDLSHDELLDFCRAVVTHHATKNA